MSARGTTFSNANIMGGSFAAVCMPSRGMFHTGSTLYHLEGEAQSVADEHTMLGEAFQSAGYYAFGTGKWQNSPMAYARSFNAGADIYFGGINDHWNLPACDYDPMGEYPKCALIKNAMESNEVSWHYGDHFHVGKHSTDIFADATINFNEKHNERNSFFSCVSFSWLRMTHEVCHGNS